MNCTYEYIYTYKYNVDFDEDWSGIRVVNGLWDEDGTVTRNIFIKDRGYTEQQKQSITQKAIELQKAIDNYGME